MGAAATASTQAVRRLGGVVATGSRTLVLADYVEALDQAIEAAAVVIAAQEAELAALRARVQALEARTAT